MALTVLGKHLERTMILPVANSPRHTREEIPMSKRQSSTALAMMVVLAGLSVSAPSIADHVSGHPWPDQADEGGGLKLTPELIEYFKKREASRRAAPETEQQRRLREWYEQEDARRAKTIDG